MRFKNKFEAISKQREYFEYKKYNKINIAYYFIKATYLIINIFSIKKIKY